MNEVEWTKPLLSLFDLLIENADGIIDDTSVERVLEWLKSVCVNDHELKKLWQSGMIETLKSDKVFSNPVSATFFLRLFGYLVSRSEVFHSLECIEDGDFIFRFLDKPRTNSGLWNEGMVRNGYFQALVSLTEHEAGISWLGKSVGPVECALDCVFDRSMFVATSARCLIAKFLVGAATCTDASLTKIADNVKLIAVVNRLKKMLNLESPTEENDPAFQIAVVDIVRLLLHANSDQGQRVLQESGLFVDCLKLMAVGDTTVCEKLVDVLCEMAKKGRSWSLDWNRLLTTQDSKEPNASHFLLGLCVDLLKRDLISTGLELVAGLGPCCAGSSFFPARWLETLFDFIEITIDLMLIQSGDRNGMNGHINGLEDVLRTELVESLLSSEEHKNTKAKQQLKRILSHCSDRHQSQIHVICQALCAVQQLTHQVPSGNFSHVFYWIRHSQALIHECVSSNSAQFSVSLYGNQKVLKSSLEYISCLAEIQSSKELFNQMYSLDNKLLHSLLGTLLYLTESSESSATVISLVFKILSKLVKAVHQDIVEALFCSKICTDLTQTSKRARQEDGSSSFEIEARVSDTDESLDGQRMAFVLYRRLRDSRWEVRDSALEFINSVVHCKNDSIDDFLCHHNIPAVVWDSINDSESYVRASALQVIGSFACHSQLWATLLGTRCLSEADILEKLSSLLLVEDEAFPRRRAMECLVLWVSVSHPIVLRILHSNSSSRRDEEIERETLAAFSPEKDAQLHVETKDDESSDVWKTPSSNEPLQRTSAEFRSKTSGFKKEEDEREASKVEILQSICLACQDFDWEVKIRALQFWEAVINYFTATPVHAVAVYDQPIASGLSERKLKAQGTEEYLQTLFKMGAMQVLRDALNDCDHMVCEKALEILTRLQDFAANPDESFVETQITTCSEFQETLGKNFSLHEFKKVMRMTDFSALIESNVAADIALRSDPVSLIEDIVIAATNSDGNLLDCY